jgi:CheY-like chemotaxis protein
MPAWILVVEASSGVRAIIADVLKANGYVVEWASDGAEALELLENRSSFDLIFSDFILPAIEGAQLYWEIGARWPHLVSRLISLTEGHDAGWIDHATLRAASVPFLLKPFLTLQLLDVVRRGLATG